MGNDPLARYDLSGLSWYGDAWDWTTDKANRAKNWSSDAITDFNMFLEWATGTGPDMHNFGPDSPQVQDMKSSPGIQDAINHFYEINEGRSCDQYLPLPRRGEGFGLSGLYHAGLNPTQQFVGSYEVNITPNRDHTITITVRNTTSMSSALYHLWPASWNYNRINIDGFSIPTPGANKYQTYTWTEPMR